MLKFLFSKKPFVGALTLLVGGTATGVLFAFKNSYDPSKALREKNKWANDYGTWSQKQLDGSMEIF